MYIMKSNKHFIFLEFMDIIRMLQGYAIDYHFSLGGKYGQYEETQ